MQVDLRQRATQLKANPYYLAYAIETGAANPHEAYERDGGNHLFSAWMGERWSELIRENGGGDAHGRITQDERSWAVSCLGPKAMVPHLDARLAQRTTA